MKKRKFPGVKKHLLELADNDTYLYSELSALRKALLKGRYYTSVESVSRSGMSRVIKICYIDKGILHGASSYVYTLAGCDKNHRITGCGMDMLFAAQYNLFMELCPDKDYTRFMSQYNCL